MTTRIILAATLAGLLATSLSAKSFDAKFQDECRYILGDKDDGRYDEEAHGFSLGVIAGIKAALPAEKRNGLYRKSLGHISDRACLRALKDRSSDGFRRKYERAAYELLTR